MELETRGRKDEAAVENKSQQGERQGSTRSTLKSAFIGVSIVVTFLAVAVTQEARLVHMLKEYCRPTAEEALWTAAFQEISDEDATILHYDGTVLVGQFVKKLNSFLLERLQYATRSTQYTKTLTQSNM